MNLHLFRKEALNERRNTLHGSIQLAQPLSIRATTGVVVSFVMAAFLFLSTFEYQRHETVRGYISPSAGLLKIRAPKSGMLDAVTIETGQQVSAGDELFRLESDIESSDGLTRQKQVLTTDNRLVEIERQIEIAERSSADHAAALKKQRSGLRTKRQQLQMQLQLKSQLVELAKTELQRLEQLDAGQFVSKREQSRQDSVLLTQRAELAAIRGELSETTARSASLDIEIGRLDDRKAEEISNLSIEKNKLVGTRLEQQALGAFVVRAPLPGTITAVQGLSGQRVGSQAGLATLLPAGSVLQATLLVPSRAIGFLQPGAEVRIYIDAFPFQHFGSKTGRVNAISLTTSRPGELGAPIGYDESVYRVTVHLDELQFESHGEVHTIRPDMTLTAELLMEQRTLLRWLMDPILSGRF
ncbi:MAG: HlyD family efflux transporter periplasmic adaptor subunit [Gammaproteobacteria bacterium]|nr:HlyD family efflux transporter periplasmic adaptor subunit [Gammaproteobacteria bacterium]